MIRNIVIIALLAALAIYSYALIGYGKKKYEPQVPRYKEIDCSVQEKDTVCFRNIK